MNINEINQHHNPTLRSVAAARLSVYTKYSIETDLEKIDITLGQLAAQGAMFSHREALCTAAEWLHLHKRSDKVLNHEFNLQRS